MSHIWRRRVAYINESCHTYDSFPPHIRIRYVTRMMKACYLYEWVMSHLWQCHATHTHKVCHTYEGGVLHQWLSHVTPMIESCYIYASVMWMAWLSRHKFSKILRNSSCHPNNHYTSRAGFSEFMSWNLLWIIGHAPQNFSEISCIVLFILSIEWPDHLWEIVSSNFNRKKPQVAFAEYRLLYRALLQKRPIIC